MHEFAHRLKEPDYVVWFDAVDFGKDDLEGNSFTTELPEEEDIVLFEAVSGIYQEKGAAKPGFSIIDFLFSATHVPFFSSSSRVTLYEDREGRYCFLDFRYFMICTPHSSLEACP